MEHTPREILRCIFEHVGISSLVNVSLVCRKWGSLVDDGLRVLALFNMDKEKLTSGSFSSSISQRALIKKIRSKLLFQLPTILDTQKDDHLEKERKLRLLKIAQQLKLDFASPVIFSSHIGWLGDPFVTNAVTYAISKDNVDALKLLHANEKNVDSFAKYLHIAITKYKINSAIFLLEWYIPRLFIQKDKIDQIVQKVQSITKSSGPKCKDENWDLFLSKIHTIVNQYHHK